MPKKKWRIWREKNDGNDGFVFFQKKIFLKIFIFAQKNVPDNVTQFLDRWLLTFWSFSTSDETISFSEA